MRTLIILSCALTIFCSNVYAARKPKVIKEIPVPTFSAKSFIVADDYGTILKEQDSETVRSIASISKLMIGMLAAEQDLTEHLEIPRKRQVQSSIPSNVRSLTRRELLTLALVKSDNFAAQILCLNLDSCVEKMNSKATELGMVNTKFYEPTGLDYGNVSTAQDLLKFLMVASINPTINELSTLAEAEIPTSGKPIKVRNTNPLTSKFSLVLSKTGFTTAAGGCLVMVMNTEWGRKIYILLGSKNNKTRIPDMERLVKEHDNSSTP